MKRGPKARRENTNKGRPRGEEKGPGESSRKPISKNKTKAKTHIKTRDLVKDKASQKKLNTQQTWVCLNMYINGDYIHLW